HWQQLMEDVDSIRRAPWGEGHLALYGIQFKSEAARKRWEKELNLETVTFEDGREPRGVSLFKIGSTDREPSRETLAAKGDLIGIVRGKMKEASEKIRSRP